MKISIFIVAVAIIAEYSIVQTQRTYNCALPAYCNDVTIDPRIQTNCVTLILGIARGGRREKLYNMKIDDIENKGELLLIAIPDSKTNTSQRFKVSCNPGSVNVGCPAGYIACVNVKCGFSTTQPTINFGQATQNAYPWNVFLQNVNNANLQPQTKGYIGGGVLIDQYFVVTAAHKIYSNIGPLNALFGLYNLNDMPAQTISVQSVYYHSGFNPSTLKNDIALLRLAQPVNIGPSANFICPPQTGIDYHVSNPGANNCVVVGFGNTSFTANNAPYIFLKQAFLPIQTYVICKSAYDSLGILTMNYLDGLNDICAGGTANIDACTGDGGSGFVCRNVGSNQFNLVGIVVWGKECGKAGIPGVYLYYPAFLNWVTTTRSCILSSPAGSACGAISKY